MPERETTCPCCGQDDDHCQCSSDVYPHPERETVKGMPDLDITECREAFMRWWATTQDRTPYKASWEAWHTAWDSRLSPGEEAENESLRGLLREVRETLNEAGIILSCTRSACGDILGGRTMPREHTHQAYTRAGEVLSMINETTNRITAEVEGEPKPTALEKQMREALRGTLSGWKVGALWQAVRDEGESALAAYADRYGEEG